jgi:hypothetical protein
MPKTEFWVHGTLAQVENHGTAGIARLGWGTTLHSMRSDNWMHFPIATPIVQRDQRARVARITVLFHAVHCGIYAIHLYDGPRQVKALEVAHATGEHSYAVDQTNVFPVGTPVPLQLPLQYRRYHFFFFRLY